jgi:hypothetical protein
VKKSSFGYLDIGYWDLFGAWNLVIGISMILSSIINNGQELPEAAKVL